MKVLAHHLRLYRRVWKGSVFVSFVSPVLYLASIGVGLGSLIQRGPVHTLGGISYVAFIAPGLLAATAMMTIKAAIRTAGTPPIASPMAGFKLYAPDLINRILPTGIRNAHDPIMMGNAALGSMPSKLIIIMQGP